jgi:hypothetical protein
MFNLESIRDGWIYPVVPLAPSRAFSPAASKPEALGSLMSLYQRVIEDRRPRQVASASKIAKLVSEHAIVPTHTGP